MSLDIERVEFLVIGGGVAGLRAAIELAPHASQGGVLVATKDRPSESTTGHAQGGIAVALSDEDEVGIHYEDTIQAGAGLSDEAAVRVLVEEGPERIKELISWGAEFDRADPDSADASKLSFTLEAAHSRRRVLHAHGDSTGRELVRVLLKKVQGLPSVRRYPSAVVVDLIMHDARCVGAYVLQHGKLRAVIASATVLATGGAGQVYAVTTNPIGATADGIAVAARAGAHTHHMEFVQFHPTSLQHPWAPHFLLSEAMRGEGARLINKAGERFMERYHPKVELAPRDVVSRAIATEIHRSGEQNVYLDLTHMDPAFVQKRFPNIYRTCLGFDLDITRAPVPVSPAMHYIMGGVRTDLDGATNIDGLFAAGECTNTGIHGANRLASNSLLEGLVYGARAGATAAGRGVASGLDKVAPLTPVRTIPAHDEIRGALRRLMWERVGIVRCERSLTEARQELGMWEFILKAHYQTRRELELKNMIQVALLITDAALARPGSVGAHFRTDSEA